RGHKVYPYLLRGVAIGRPDQVWSADITYVPLAAGFMYLAAVIDRYSRYVVAWGLSNTLDGSFCLEMLDEALARGRPEVFNADQGVQFTAEAFTGRLLAAGVQVSMDGRGRCLDNVFVERLWRSVKYEELYLRCYETVPELCGGLGRYFPFYNEERPHQSLGYRTPAEVYRQGRPGGGGRDVLFRLGHPQPRGRGAQAKKNARGAGGGGSGPHGHGRRTSPIGVVMDRNFLV